MYVAHSADAFKLTSRQRCVTFTMGSLLSENAIKRIASSKEALQCIKKAIDLKIVVDRYPHKFNSTLAIAIRVNLESYKLLLNYQRFVALICSCK